MDPGADFYDALILLDTHPLTGEYLGVVAFGCGVTERISTGNGMLADVDRAAERFPYCVVDGSVSDAVQRLYDDLYTDELFYDDEAA